MNDAHHNAYRDRVVIVTGSSAGLGRQYALDFAARGARVVVHGRSEATERVAAEIVQAGGQAASIRCDAEGGAAIVDAALAAYGRCDAIVVNAGLTRDRTYLKLTPQDWREVVRVHLDAAYAVTAAAWPHIAKTGGHIVITTSGAGLFGRYGQANYSAAKAGLIGLTLALAREGARYGVRVNAIAPWAATEMTRVAFNDAMQDALRAEFVSPFVLALCHPQSQESGAVIEIGGGWAAKLRWERAAGLRLPPSQLTPEAILARWPEIGDFSAASQHPHAVEDTIPFLGLPQEADLKS